MIDAADAAPFIGSLSMESALPLTGAKIPMNEAQIDKTSKDFEAMFISQMLGQMFGESSGIDAFGDADTDEVYKGLMMNEYGKQIARSGGIGIADYVKRELLKLQEVQS